MWLASVDVIRTDLGFADMTDINSAIQAALDSAESMLASMLGMDFSLSTLADIFFVERPTVRRGVAVSTEFRLTRGLIQTPTAVIMAGTYDDLQTNSTDISSKMLYDLEKGVPKDLQTNYRFQYVKFSYSAGFAVDGSNASSYNLTQVPAWLQEAAKLKAKILLADSAPVEEANIKIDTLTLGSQLNAIVANKLRYTPLAIFPL